MAEKGVFKAIDYLGECVDILYLDPINLGSPEGKKNRRVFLFEKYKQTAGGLKIPLGSQYGAGNIGTEESQTVSSTETGEFQEALSDSYAFNAGFGEIFSFSLSKSVKSCRSQLASAEKVTTYTEARKVSGNLELIPDMKTEPLSLDNLFAQRVAELPDDANDPSQVKKYDDFIKTFGTHFMYKVTMGGRAHQSCEIRKISKANKETTEEDWKVVANAAYKGASAGAESAEYQKRIAELEQKFEFTASGMSWSPANGASANLKTWMGTVDDDPVICACGLVSLNHVLKARFFPNDLQIEKKQRILSERLAKYITEKGKDSGLIRANQPISIVTRDEKMAVANVNGELKLEAVSDDPRQQWIIESPKEELFIPVVEFPDSNEPVRETPGCFFKSMVDGKYLLRDKRPGGGLFPIGFVASKNDTVSLGLKPASNDGAMSPKGGRRFIHQGETVCLQAYARDWHGSVLTWSAAYVGGEPLRPGSATLTRAAPERFLFVSGGAGRSTPTKSDLWKIVRKYDPMTDLKEAPDNWGN